MDFLSKLQTFTNKQKIEYMLPINGLKVLPSKAEKKKYSFTVFLNGILYYDKYRQNDPNY
jgi:hypothetical protein